MPKTNPGLPMIQQRLVSHLLLAGILLLFGTPTARAQETEAGTRQFAVAVGFQNQKLYEPAIDEWQTFLKKFPQDPRVDKASHYLGTCQLQAKQYPAAVATFENVAKQYPKFELLDQSLLNLGTAWYSQAQESKQPTDYDKAELAFGRMLKQFPKSSFAARAMSVNTMSGRSSNKSKGAFYRSASIAKWRASSIRPSAMAWRAFASRALACGLAAGDVPLVGATAPS